MAKRKVSNKISTVSFEEILKPSFLLFCENAIIGQDDTLSLIKIIERLKTTKLPAAPGRFILVAEFDRIREAAVSCINPAGAITKVDLLTPKENVIDVGEFAVSEILEENPWLTYRFILDLSSIRLLSEGFYTFRIFGKTNGSSYQQVLAKSFQLILEDTVEGS